MNQRFLLMALFLAPVFFAGDAQEAAAAVFITELHYDDSTGSGDVGERVVVVATNGETLTDYRIVLYNGSVGAAYDTDAAPVGELRSCGGTVGVGAVSYRATYNLSPFDSTPTREWSPAYASRAI